MSGAAKITATDGAASDRFGASIAVSADGLTMLVGAPLHDVDGNKDQGCVYVFSRSSAAADWQQAAKLTATPPSWTTLPKAGYKFGTSVALSADGRTAVVGATYDNEVMSFQGDVHVFMRTAGSAVATSTTWKRTTRLTLSGNENTVDISGNMFGKLVAISADGTTVAAFWDQAPDGGGQRLARVLVFKRASNNATATWVRAASSITKDYWDDGFGHPRHSLLIDDVNFHPALTGFSLSADGGHMVVGSTHRVGHAYFYKSASQTSANMSAGWVHSASLGPADCKDDTWWLCWFGYGVTMSDDANLALVGAYAAPNKIYILQRRDFFATPAAASPPPAASQQRVDVPLSLSVRSALGGSWSGRCANLTKAAKKLWGASTCTSGCSELRKRSDVVFVDKCALDKATNTYTRSGFVRTVRPSDVADVYATTYGAKLLVRSARIPCGSSLSISVSGVVPLNLAPESLAALKCN